MLGSPFTDSIKARVESEAVRHSFAKSLICSAFDRFSNVAGTSPSKLLRYNSSRTRLVRLPSSAGMAPLRRLLTRRRVSRLAKLPSSLGISPVRPLKRITRVVRLVRLPISAGMSPTTARSPPMKSFSRLMRLPISAGISPTRAISSSLRSVIWPVVQSMPCQSHGSI